MMMSLDTNIVVRLLTMDDKKQAEIALSIIEKNAVYITKTVILECEWVLRGCYGIEAMIIANAIEGLLGVPTVTVEDARNMSDVLMLYRKGMDFGDAMHLISSKSAGKFLTFDKKLIKKANQVGLQKVILAS